jgi:hypothetical protein
MNSMPPFPSELWEHIPVAVREYIRTLETRVTALEATVQRLLEESREKLGISDKLRSLNLSLSSITDLLPSVRAHRARRGS